MRKQYRINHSKAWAYFVYIGKIPVDAKKNEWCLHHKDTTLKENDPQRYDEWRVEDLEPMTRSEHMKLHGKLRGMLPEVIRAGVESRRGKPRSEETKRRVSEGLRRYWDKYWEEHPEKRPMTLTDEERKSRHEESVKKRAEGLRKFFDSERGFEHRKKMSERFKAIKRTREWYDKVAKSLNKRVRMIDDDGVLVKEFESLKQASEFLHKKSPANLSTAIKNKSKYCGYFFEYM